MESKDIKLKYKMLIWPILAMAITFSILTVFFYFKAYFSYDLSIVSNTPYLSNIPPVQLSEKIKIPFSDLKGGTYYIDYVEVTSEGKLSFTGRYYSVQAADVASSRAYLQSFISNLVGTFIAENVCSFSIDPAKFLTDLETQLKEVNSNSSTCRSLVTPRVASMFEISDFHLSDSGRIKKLLFISLIISAFLGGAVYVAIESRNAFK